MPIWTENNIVAFNSPRDTAQHITINNPPIEKAVELYSDMREKAREDILSACTISNTLFECQTWVARRADMLFSGLQVSARFKINEQTFERTFAIEPNTPYLTSEDMVKLVFSAFQSIVAEELTREACNTHYRVIMEAVKR